MRDPEKQRAYMREYWRKRGGCHVNGSSCRKYCDCGQLATVMSCGAKVCSGCREKERRQYQDKISGHNEHGRRFVEPYRVIGLDAF